VVAFGVEVGAMVVVAFGVEVGAEVVVALGVVVTAVHKRNVSPQEKHIQCATRNPQEKTSPRNVIPAVLVRAAWWLHAVQWRQLCRDVPLPPQKRNAHKNPL